MNLKIRFILLLRWNVLKWHLSLCPLALPPAAGGLLCEALPSGNRHWGTPRAWGAALLNSQLPFATWLTLSLCCYKTQLLQLSFGSVFLGLSSSTVNFPILQHFKCHFEPGVGRWSTPVISATWQIKTEGCLLQVSLDNMVEFYLS